MAKQVVEVIVDDLTGQPIDGEVHSITLMVNERSTQVDLSEDNAKRLETFLAPYFAGQSSPKPTTRDKATTAPAQKSRTRTQLPTQPTAKSRQALEEIRSWAKQNGMKVADRGRIPFAVMDAYTRAHMVTGAAAK